MTAFRVNPNDTSYVIKLNKGATSATDGRIPFWGPPNPPRPFVGPIEPPFVGPVEPSFVGPVQTLADRAAVMDARLTAEKAARKDAALRTGVGELLTAEGDYNTERGKALALLDPADNYENQVRPKPYSQLKHSNDLPGGYEDFYGTSSPRGVFANYAGTTRKFNSHPQTTQTMARLAIPISGNPYDFITKSGLGATLGPLANSIIIQGNSGLGYIDFLLQNIQESFSEKVQVSDTIGDNYAAFFFGMSPPTFSFAGQFLNTYQDDWRAAFHLLYRNLLRGTMLARRNLILSLYYDNIIITGYMLNHNQQYTAEMQMASNFSFNMLVKNMTIFRLPGTMPTQADRLPSDIGFKTFAGVQRAAIQRTSRVVNVVAMEETPSKAGGAATNSPAIDPSGEHWEGWDSSLLMERDLGSMEYQNFLEYASFNVARPPGGPEVVALARRDIYPGTDYTNPHQTGGNVGRLVTGDL